MAHERYLRNIILTNKQMSELLNLPEGFEMEGHQWTMEEYDHQIIRITCPKESQYLHAAGGRIKEVDAKVHTNPHGVVTKLWWPELGQEEPSDETFLEIAEDYITRAEHHLKSARDNLRVTKDHLRIAHD